jgi:integrase
VPLNASALEAVDSVSGTSLHEPVFRWSHEPHEGKPVTPNGLLQVVYKACDALGLPRFYPYLVRHLVATEVVNASGTDNMASALLGHSPSSTVVRRYSRDRLKLAVEGARLVGASA